jgi:hypothetical protein
MSTQTFRLGGKTRKGVLVAHIASAGVWVGIEVALGALVFAALLTSDPQLVASCYQAAELFAVWPMLTSGLVCLASGVLLGLGSKYGLLRYWWVVIKLALNLVLCTLILLLLAPGVHEVAAAGRDFTAGLASTVPVSTDLLFPPIVSGVSLVFAMVLSVFKPWGRIRQG